ncbi:unnamed protein product, partial [Heterotrigona itama]
VEDLTDEIPTPYPNEEAARLGPPTLALARLTSPSRRSNVDYVFYLFTGWMEPPAGIDPSNQEGRYFNMFHEGMVEYDDGTPATESQMAKDVAEFLTWTACSEQDTRKIMTIKSVGTTCCCCSSPSSRSTDEIGRLAYLPNTITTAPRHIRRSRTSTAAEKV